MKTTKDWLIQRGGQQSAVSSQQENIVASENDSNRHNDLLKADSRRLIATPPTAIPTDIVLTAGASCPDVLLDEVLQKIVGWFPNSRSVEEVLEPYNA